MQLRGDDVFRNFFFLPDREIIIDRVIKIHGKKYCLAAMTEMADVCTMWVISETEVENIAKSHHFELAKTNRESILQGRAYKPDLDSLSFKALTFGDKVFKVGSAGSSRIMEGQGDDAIKVKHFLDKGLSEATLRLFEPWKMVVTGYDLMEGEALDIFDLDFKGPLKVETTPCHKTINVDQVLTLPFASYKEPVEVVVEDPDSNRTYRIYINGILAYDLWAEKAKEDQETIKKPIEMSLEDNQLWQAQLEQAYLKLCPKHQVLPLLQYEVEANVSLHVHTSEWLDRKIDDSHDNGCGSVGLLFGRGKRTLLGLKGFELRSVQVEAVDKDFCGVLDLEIVDLIEVLPAESFYFERSEK